MTVYSIFYLFLSYCASLIVTTSSVTLPSMTKSVSARNSILPCHDQGRCHFGTGQSIRGENMERHLGPNVTITYRGTGYDGDFFPGHIELQDPGDIPKLPTAILAIMIHRWSSPAGIDGTSKYFVRMILDSKNGADFGVLYVNRPTPDPDTQFQSLLDQPLIAGIPRGLRSEVDPASLIPLPTPTEGCHNRKRCIHIFPVSNGIFLLVS